MTYKIQIDDEVRNATADEAAAIDAQRAESARLEAEREAQLAAAESARAKLKKLGLTDDEIAAITRT